MGKARLVRLLGIFPVPPSGRITPSECYPKLAKILRRNVVDGEHGVRYPKTSWVGQSYDDQITGDERRVCQIPRLRLPCPVVKVEGAPVKFQGYDGTRAMQAAVAANVNTSVRCQQ